VFAFSSQSIFSAPSPPNSAIVDKTVQKKFGSGATITHVLAFPLVANNLFPSIPPTFNSSQNSDTWKTQKLMKFQVQMNSHVLLTFAAS
jgi:hypothetical protein